MHEFDLSFDKAMSLTRGEFEFMLAGMRAEAQETDRAIKEIRR